MAQLGFTTNTEKQWKVAPNSAGTLRLSTNGKYLDRDIDVVTGAAATPALAITDQSSTGLTVSTTNSAGYYACTTSLTGKMTFGTAGWITTDGASATDSSVTVGRIKAGTSSNATYIPDVERTQTITVEAGYYHNNLTYTVDSMSSGTKAVLTASSNDATATVDTLVYNFNATSKKFNITGSKAITGTANAGVSTAGYAAITLTGPGSVSGTASVSTTVNEVGLSLKSTHANSSADTFTPSIAKQDVASGDTWVSAANGNATTTKPTTGAYIAVKSAANTGTLKVSPYVSSAGYGIACTNTSNLSSGTGNGVFTEQSFTVGANASSTTYVPVKTGTVKTDDTSKTINQNPAISSTVNAQGKYEISYSSSKSISPVITTAGYIDPANSIGTVTPTTYTTYGLLTVDQSKIGVGASTSAATTAATAGGPSTITPSGTADQTIVVTAGWYPEARTISLPKLGSGAFSVSTDKPTSGTEVTGTNVQVPLNGYLKLSAGYYGESYISLGTLVKDYASGTSEATANYILSGYHAVNDAGQDIVGTIPTVNLPAPALNSVATTVNPTGHSLLEIKINSGYVASVQTQSIVVYDGDFTSI